MLDGDDEDPVRLDPAIDAVGEATDESGANIAIDRRTEFGRRGDLIQNRPDLREELLAQGPSLALLPKAGVVHLVPDVLVKRRGANHRGRLTCSFMASQVVTEPGSASRRSNSAF